MHGLSCILMGLVEDALIFISARLPLWWILVSQGSLSNWGTHNVYVHLHNLVCNNIASQDDTLCTTTHQIFVCGQYLICIMRCTLLSTLIVVQWMINSSLTALQCNAILAFQNKVPCEMRMPQKSRKYLALSLIKASSRVISLKWVQDIDQIKKAGQNPVAICS